jgi:hypothetical protein
MTSRPPRAAIKTLRRAAKWLAREEIVPVRRSVSFQQAGYERCEIRFMATEFYESVRRVLVCYRVLKLSRCSPSFFSNPLPRLFPLGCVIGSSAHDFREQGSQRGIKPWRPTEAMGQFVLDDPFVPFEEDFEGLGVRCIRGQTEKNLSVTYRTCLGPLFFCDRRRHCLQSHAITNV